MTLLSSLLNELQLTFFFEFDFHWVIPANRRSPLARSSFCCAYQLCHCHCCKDICTIRMDCVAENDMTNCWRTKFCEGHYFLDLGDFAGRHTYFSLERFSILTSCNHLVSVGGCLKNFWDRIYRIYSDFVGVPAHRDPCKPLIRVHPR